MKLRWFAVGAALVVAALMVACDEDAVGPSNTGDVTIRLVFDTKTVSPPLGTVSPDSTQRDPPQGRSSDVEIQDASLEQALSQQPRVSQGVAAIDRVHIQLRGPDTLTRQVTPSGGIATASFSKILVGSYSVLVELVDAGEVSHVGTGSLRVNADVNNEATITAQSYTPSIGTAPDTTTNFAFDLTWSTAAQVDSGYVIQSSTNASFTGATSDSVPPPSTSYTASVLQTGPTYYRVRAGGTRSLAAASGKWSDPHRVEVEADTLPAQIPVATFPISFSANIDLAGTTDQFTLWACRADTLTVQVTALGLTPPSPLDPFISAAGAQSQNPDQDESLLAVLTTDDSVTVTVGGESGSVGHYDVLIDLGFGQFNNQDGTCVPSATQLAFTQFPSDIAAGDVMIPNLKVEAHDSSGSLVSDFTGDVSLVFDNDPSGGQASLLGTTTVAAVSGTALFTDISVGRAANGYTLRATSGTLAPAVSNSFNVTPTNPSSVGIIDGDMQTGEAGTQLPTAPAVEVSDAFGNNVPGVLVTFVPSGDGSVSIDTVSTDGSGFALVNWTLGTSVGADSDTLTAFVPDVDTVRFIATATPGTPDRVIFFVQPSQTAAGDVFMPPIDVRVLDSLGNLVTAATDNVTIAIGNDPNGGIATLGGTPTIAASGGIAGFTDLSIDLDGPDYTLVITSGSLVPDTTSVFRVMPSGTSAYWTAGAGSTDWSDPGNWSTGVVPDSADRVFIGPEPSFIPTLTQDVSIASVHVEDGVTLETNGFTLTVSENVVGGSTIAGTGWVVMTGTGGVSGQLPNLRVAGDVTVIGRVTASGDLDVSGSLTMNGYYLSATAFSTSGGTGVLVMQNAADTLWLGGQAIFDGGDLSGLLTAGNLFVSGDVASSASLRFRAEGNHTLHFNAAGVDTQRVSLTDPPNSPFNNVTMPQSPTIVLQSPMALNGTLISSNSGIPAIVGDTLTVQGVDVDGLRLDGAPIVIGQGSITQFDNVTFVNFGPGERQLTVARDGDSFMFSGLQFSQDNPGSDIYVSANDLAPSDGNVLTIELVVSSPLTADGTSGEEELNGAVISWAEPPALIQFTSGDTTLASLLDSYSPGITIEDQFGTPLLRTDVNWSSHDPGVASVTADGVVTAATTGFARIRATSPANPAIADSIIVTVTNAPVTIELDRTLDTLFVLGDTLRYRATVRNARGDSIPGAPVGWQSTNDSIAPIGGTGLATSVGVGQAFIIGTAAALADSATLVVLDTLAASVVVSPPAATMVVGENEVLTATVLDAADNPMSGKTVVWTSLNPAIATIDGSGQATAVGIGQVTTEARVDGRVSGYAVLTVTDPNLVAHVNTWAPQTTGVADSLLAVWGLSDTLIFAVGENGRIVRYNGSSWNPMPSISTPRLSTLWGTSATDVLTVAADGSLYRFNGTDWQSLGAPPSPTLPINDIWATSPVARYVVGANGEIFFHNGSSWSTLTSGTTEQLNAVWGTDTSNIFVVGDNGTILHSADGSTWTPMSSGVTTHLRDIWGIDSTDVFVVGDSGTTLRYDGTNWLTDWRQPFGLSCFFDNTLNQPTSVWGSSGTDVYTPRVRDSVLSAVVRFDGLTCQQIDLVAGDTALTIWGIPNGDMVMAGTNGLILHGYRGATVTVTPEVDTLLTSGSTLQLTPQVFDAFGSPISGTTFSWASDDPTVVTVNSTGLVTAAGVGIVKVRVAPAPALRALSPKDTATISVGNDGEITEALIARSFRTWWNATQGPDPSVALSAIADEITVSWGNFALKDLSSEPRVAFDNTPGYRYAAFAEVPWDGMYAALSAVYDGLIAIDSNGVEIGGFGGPDNPRARAFAKFVQGLAHGWLALMFDSAYVLDETVNLSDPIVLKPYPNILTAAVGYFDEAIAIAQGNSFTLPSSWINGNALTESQLVQLINSYKARFMTQVARTPAERSALDWVQVIALVQSGISADFEIQGDGHFLATGGVWNEGLKALSNETVTNVWARADYKTIGTTEIGAGLGYDNWLQTAVDQRNEFGLVVPDARITGGDSTLDGTDFQFKGLSPFPANRGTYHYSEYGHKRYENFVVTTSGFAPIAHMTLAEMNLIQAEGHLRVGTTLSAVPIINATRVTRGMLPAATSGDADLFDKMIYEKRIETFALCSGCAYFDRRGWGPLSPTGPNHHQGPVEGTPLHFAPPGRVLQELGLPNYTYGGLGNEGGTLAPAPAPPPAGIMAGPPAPGSATAMDIYAFRHDPDMPFSEKLRYLDVLDERAMEPPNTPDP